MTKTESIREKLTELREGGAFQNFNASLIPTVPGDKVLGVRTPALRTLAKELAKDPGIEEFLHDLPHVYFEENQLHAFILSLEKDFGKCVENVDKFLPYVDNWATCDQMRPKCFAGHREELLVYIERWVKAEPEYMVRFGVGMLMTHYLEEAFTPATLETVLGIKREEYYIRMMIAWYIATALAKQYEAVLPVLLDNRLEVWTHNKAIQKAVESFRITPEQKAYLRTLKR